ncbi:hypothetical protein WICPIJ_001696 [Wickerhamomyces pijperi]|uniref:Uncharacterized protein n=1 Tax=Wickerhamomyces pijperi TaxID=599730 RepID=A0A9P8QB49_WICPI|nr:hypothetical protein WICPIJ_001696 [Wickerhamomyces pijperi]
MVVVVEAASVMTAAKVSIVDSQVLWDIVLDIEVGRVDRDGTGLALTVQGDGSATVDKVGSSFTNQFKGVHAVPVTWQGQLERWGTIVKTTLKGDINWGSRGRGRRFCGRWQVDELLTGGRG